MRKIFVCIVVCTLLLNGCTANEKDLPKRLRLTTTTSVNDSGLLEYLRPYILEEANISLEIVSLGSGAALEAGKRGDADVLLVHSPAVEKIFVDEGYGIKRSTFMYNFFVIIGPSSDPAQIKSLSAADALKKIELLESPFISRGDNSGTHSKEKSLWKLAGLDAEVVSTDTSFYVSAGSGMGATLTMASEKQAYTLSDLATFLSMKGKLSLDIIINKSPDLRNDYSIIVINPDKVANVDVDTAKAFEEWMLSDRALKLISEYGKDTYKEALFFTE